MMQKSLLNRGYREGVDFYSEPIDERYAFGAGNVFKSVVRWVYPVNPHGRPSTLRMALVPPDVPGLIGPDEMAIFQIAMDFKSVPPTVTLGNIQDEMRFSDTRHPVLDLLLTTFNHMKVVEVTVTTRPLTPF